MGINKEVKCLRQQLEAAPGDVEKKGLVEEPVDSLQAFQQLEWSLGDQSTWEALVRYTFQSNRASKLASLLRSSFC